MSIPSKPRGQPPKHERHRRTCRIDIRISPQERDILAEAGVENFSAWARDLLLKAARHTKRLRQ